MQGRNGKGSIYVFAAGNGGDMDDTCAADGYPSSIYTIGIGSADSNGAQAYYDENCSGKLAVTFVSDPVTSVVSSHMLYKIIIAILPISVLRRHVI